MSSNSKQKRRLVVIDANALLHRSYHALPPLTSPDGQVVNGVYGFFSTLFKMVKELAPDYMVACFDLPKPTFRHKKYAAYKAHRPKVPEDLSAQVPILKEALNVFKVPVLEKEGFEADDIIGTIAEKMEAKDDIEVVIVTGDLDTLQLASPNTKIYTMRRGMKDTIIYGPQGVKERYGFIPAKLPDYKGLKGDPSDNIPGVRGVGKKTASKILKRFEGLNQLFAALTNEEERKKLIEQRFLSQRIADKLIEKKDQALFSKKLAEIRRDAPVDLPLEQARWPQFNMRRVKEIFVRLGFRSLLNRLPKLDKKENPTSDTKELNKEEFLEKIKRADELFLAPKDGKLLVAISGFEKVVSPDELSSIIESGEKEISGHDLKSCLYLLENVDAGLCKLKFDTKIAGYLLNPSQGSYHLKDLRIQYTKNLFRLCDQLEKELRAKNQTKLFYEIEMPLIRVLYKMEKTGIKVERGKVEKLEKEVGRSLEKLQKEIFDLAGCKFNLNSPQQLSEVLFEKLELPQDKITKTKEGHISTAASELAKLKGEHEVIDLIFSWREYEKLHSSYLKPFLSLCKDKKRIHPQFNQTQTATGRLSSSQPNLQNIPLKGDWASEFRQAFIASEGFKLFSFDYSQVELRVIASLADCGAMIKAFRAGKDIHTLTASRVFDVAPKEVTKELRNKAKALNFGVIYGISAYGFAQSADVSRDEAQEFIEGYFRRFPEIKEYIETTKQAVDEEGYVETVFGRRRYLPEINSSNKRVQAQAERMAINHPVQGSAADVIKMAMNKIYTWKKKSLTGKDLFSEAEEDTLRLILQIHDELIFEIKQEKIKSFVPHIKNIMEQAYKLKAPLVVDVKAGENWGKLEKYEG